MITIKIISSENTIIMSFLKNTKTASSIKTRWFFCISREIIDFKRLNQSRKRARQHRLQGGEKLNRASQKQASKGTLFCGVPDAQTGHSPHRHKLQRLQTSRGEPLLQIQTN